MTLPIKQEHERTSERTVNTTPLMPHRRAAQENASAMALPDGVHERGGKVLSWEGIEAPARIEPAAVEVLGSADPDGMRVASLIARIRARNWVVGIAGLGYVGLPLMRAATRAGFRVLGFDIDEERVAVLNGGRSPIRHLGHDFVRDQVASGRFEATARFERAAEADAILICVPTPLGPHREPDLSFIEGTVSSLGPYLRQDQLLILESTTWPGTTREVVRPLVEATGLVVGLDIFLAYSPEREDPGNLEFDITTTPKLVAGDGDAARALALTLYEEFGSRAVSVPSTDVAEAAKLTENVFRAVNIALINELKTVFTSMGIDVYAVIDAAKTKPFGYMPFWPGPGLGGHCIPIDPFYLTWKAQEHGVRTRFIELAGEINTAMPRWVVERLAAALDARFRKGLNGTRVLIVGIAYKKNVDDMRESPALAIMDLLLERGAEVAYHDPHCPVIPPTREHRHLAGKRSLPLDPSTLANIEAALIVTDHDGIDYAALVAGVPLVVDTRNATRHVDAGRERIVMA
jgi:UDP-N-acetyl-D-glucosamine dehydrogenase